MTVIAVANQKGGVGKTTSVINFAAYAAMAGLRVLVVDNDPQGNASSVLAPEGDFLSVYEGQPPVATSIANLWIIPSGSDLIDQDKRLVLGDGGRSALKRALTPLRESYDLIFVDCPPTLAMLPLNALLAADCLIIPIQCEYYSMEGLGQMIARLEAVQADRQQPLRLAGILLTMADLRDPFQAQVAAEIRRHLGDRVFTTVIPRDTSLAAAPSHGRSIVAHDPLSPGAIAYLAATKELLHGISQ